jgi:hypothetical protein
MQKLDDVVMSCAEKTLHAYNKVTGKQKLDLATNFNSSGSIFALTGTFLENPILGFLTSPVYIVGCYKLHQRNKELTKKEQRTQNTGSLLSPENYSQYARVGYTCYALTPFYGQFTLYDDNVLGMGFLTAGMFLLGSGQHVMRVQDVDKGKSVFAKVKEKLLEKKLAYT